MARSLSLIVILAALATIAIAEVQNLDVHVVEDVNKFKLENPDVKLRALSPTPRQNYRYTVGTRHTDDIILAQGNNNFAYPTFQDVQTRLNYPITGYAGVVHFIEVEVDQSSGMTDIYVVSGTIDSRHIAIIVEAKRTNFFSYKATFWGIY